MPSKLQRFLSGGWSAMSAADTQIYYDGAWHDPCSGPKTMWHFKDGSWQKFPCVAGGILYSCYHQNLYPDGPFPTLYTDYTMLAVANDTSQDVFIKPDPFHEQGYACWSPDFSKIVFMRGDRTQLSAGAWPESQDLTPPIPPNFGSTASKYELCVMDADGSNETVLRSNIFSEASVISPDNSMVAYVGHNSDNNRIYESSDIRVVNIDGSDDRSIYDMSGGTFGGVQSFIVSRIPTWTADNHLVAYYQEYDTSTDPATYITSEMRKYDPTDGSYVVIWDVMAYAAANGYDINNFSANLDGQCGYVNNKHVVGWNHYDSPGGYQRQTGPYFCIVECVAGATPIFINTEDVPWYDWETFTTNTPVVAPAITSSTSVLDNFNRADSSSLGSDWTQLPLHTGDQLGVASNQAFETSTGSSLSGRAFYSAGGTFTDCEAYIDVASGIPATGTISVGARIGSGDDGYWVSANLVTREVKLEKHVGGVVTVLFAFTPSLSVNQVGSRIGIQVYGNTLSLFIYYVSTGWVNWFSTTDSDFTSGYLGFAIDSTSSNIGLDNFGGGAITITPSTSFQDLSNTQDQVFWNQSNTEFMIHTEIADPSWGFRTWIAIALNPDTMESWSFAFSPNDPATIPHFGTDTGYTEADTTPPFAHDSYIPTWFGDKLAMTGMYNDPDTFGNDGDPESNSFSVFLDIAVKENGGTAYWLALSRYPQGYRTDDFYVDERMLITGIGYPTWFEDEQLA